MLAYDDPVAEKLRDLSDACAGFLVDEGYGVTGRVRRINETAIGDWLVVPCSVDRHIFIVVGRRNWCEREGRILMTNVTAFAYRPDDEDMDLQHLPRLWLTTDMQTFLFGNGAHGDFACAVEVAAALSEDYDLLAFRQQTLAELSGDD